jgi:hypothetical protein
MSPVPEIPLWFELGYSKKLVSIYNGGLFWSSGLKFMVDQ